MTSVDITQPCPWLAINGRDALWGNDSRPNLWENGDAPGGAGNTIRGLTRSLDLTKEGLVMKATRVCSVAECTRPYRCRGYCNLHYRRWMEHGDPNPAHMQRGDEGRFWAKVAKAGPDECWLWTAGRRGPYGLFNVPPTTIGAHRFAYELTHGPIPDGAFIDHRCRVKLCVNPKHLQLADPSLNGQNLSGATRRSKSGVRGVWFDKTNGKWVGQAKAQGRTYSAGSHDSMEDAEAAVIALRNRVQVNNLVDRGVSA